MTPTAYAAAKARGFTMDEAHAADRLIKETTLANLTQRLEQIDLNVAEYCVAMARFFFGSVETDEFLTKMECYPDWM